MPALLLKVLGSSFKTFIHKLDICDRANTTSKLTTRGDAVVLPKLYRRVSMY